jgi:hypothetical protein
MTTLHLQWELLAAVCAVLTFAGGLLARGWKRSVDSAVILREISKAVRGDGTDENPSLAKRFADVNAGLGELKTSQRDLGRTQADDRQRVVALEAVAAADRRATRHAVRNLQHQVGFVFGHLNLGSPPAAEPNPLDDLPAA